MSACNHCNKTIETESDSGASIKCFVCKKVFHASCAGVTKTVMKNVCNQKSFRWNCEQCNKSVDTVITNIAIFEKLNRIEEAIKSRDKKIDELTKKVDEISNKSQQSACNSVSATPVTKRRWGDTDTSDVRTPISENVSNTPKRIRFANSNVNNNNKLPARKIDENILIVKTKVKSAEDMETEADTENKSETAADVVKRSLDPIKDNVKIARQTANGHVVLQFKDKESMNTVKSKLNAAAGATHDVAEPKVYKPLVKIHNLESRYVDKQMLRNDLIAQNPEIFSSESNITVIDCKKYHKRETNTKKRQFTDEELLYATIEIDLDTFRKISATKYLLCGWHRCAAYEHVMVLRCFKCNEYGHIADECKQTEAVCPLCSDQHEMKDCKATEHKCINCTKYNEKYRTKVDSKHPAFSIKCPVMCMKVNQRKKHIRYEL